MLTRKKISVVPIVYYEEGNIEELYKRLKTVLKKITPNFEIIYVCNDSTDNSEEILRKLAKKDKQLTVVFHSRNFGPQNSFTTGMKQAIGDAVVIMDGDLQDPPELIEEFAKKWLEGFEVVYGIRRERTRNFGAIWEFIHHLFYVVFNKLSYIKVPLDAGDFSLMDKKVVDHINSLPEKDRFIRGLRAWVGFKQTGVSYIRPNRFWGQSSNNFISNLNWAKQAIFSFSYLPLEWIFYLAMSSFAVSFLAIIFYIIWYIIKPDAPRGFLTILVAVLFIGSIQLITLSIISEYLRRIFEEVKGRPTAIVREIINNHRKK